MPSRRSRIREKGKDNGQSEKMDLPVKHETKVKHEIISIDLIDDEDAPPPIKSEAKREVKAEPLHEKRAKEKKAKVKKEKAADREDERERSRSRRKDKERGKEKEGRRRGHSRSRSRRRSPSSSSSSSSSESISDLYRRLKPYTKVILVNLVRKASLNGMTGQVVHPSTAVSPCPPGCILVRLETGREIAVKPPNVAPLASFHKGPQQAKQSQENRLQQVLKTIKLNVDNVMERTKALRDTDGGSLSIMDDGSGTVQGGIGHML